MKKSNWQGYYNYTVILTYAGMLFAFRGILMALNDRYWDAVILLMISGVCDMFDGAVASTKKGREENEKRFGIQIDSLSDLISFGVMPALFVYMFSERSRSSALIGSLFVLAALIRLAYFNVCEEERQKENEGKREYYSGLPVTTMAMFLPFVYLVENKWFSGTNAIPYLVLLVVCGTAFLSPIRIKKPYGVRKVALIIIGLLLIIGIASLGFPRA